MSFGFLLAGLLLAVTSYALIGGTAGIVLAVCLVASGSLLAWISRP